MEETLGKRIVSHRKKLGMTQDQLAEKLGVTAQAVSKWENDLSCPDIAMLPKLAALFSTTTDALLGIVKEAPVREATVEVIEDEDDDSNNHWEFRFDSSRKDGIYLGILVLLIGSLYLAVNLLKLEIGLWDLVWPSALLIFGISGLYPRFSVIRLGMAVCGGFFLVNNFLPMPIHLDNGVVWALIILLAGAVLLSHALRKPAKPIITFTKHGVDQTPRNQYTIHENSFRFDAAFGDRNQTVSLPLLRDGMINTSFGDYEVDLSGVDRVAEDCRVEANVSFGDLTIFVPSKFRVNCSNSAAFAEVEIEGKPDAVPAGTIQLNANVSFGQITIEYI